MTAATVPLAPVRRWIGRTQSAHRERGATAGNIYFTVLFIAVVGGILHKQLAVVFWPTAPNASALAGGSLVLVRHAGAGSWDDRATQERADQVLRG